MPRKAAICRATSVCPTTQAFGSVRPEPTPMLLGHAAGPGAAQAARRGVAVRDVDVPALQDALRDAGQVLAP
jgi:hypothetical protein